MAGAAAAQTSNFNIAAGDLKAALDAFARQSGVQLIYRIEDVRGARSRGVLGSLPPDQALARLLDGAPFAIRRDPSGAIALVRTGSSTKDEPAKAQAEPPIVLEEVVVTGKTGTQPVRKISGSASALGGAQLEALGAQGFADYLTRTPGVVYNAGVPGLSTAAIRGVATTIGVGNNQGTTGYFINDVPLTDPFYSAGIPDIDAFDVDSVTILRGPQGTLFGAASLGGAINYQAARPNLSAFQAHVQATGQTTRGGEAGGAAKLMLNAPIVQDRLALRAVYVHRVDGGYINNPRLGRESVNRTTTDGGRIQLAWTPAPATRITYLFLDQSQDTADVGYEEPLLAGRLQKTARIAEPADFRTQIHSLRVDQDLGFATLTASAAYHKKTSLTVGDTTPFFAAVLPGAAPVSSRLSADGEGASFELRLASPRGRRLEYLIGAYHDRIDEQIRQAYSAPNAAAVIETVYSPTYGAGVGEATAPGGVFFAADVPFRGRETALFGEAAYRLTGELKLTLGGRLFETRSDSTTTTDGFFNLLSSGVLHSSASGAQKQTGFAPKAAITWTPNADLMAYGLVSKGFRYGGPNINASSPGFAIPPSFDSDSLVNYELGVRSDWLGRRLQIDATAFFIDWSRIQLQLYSPLGLTYLANAGRATSQGVEASVAWRALPQLTLQSNLTYLDAALASPFDPGGGQPVIPKGATLPGASKWQISSVLSYDWADGPGTPRLILSHRYISRAPGDLAAGAPQGGYNQFDARATFYLAAVDLSVFAQNIGNSHGVTSASLLGGPLQRFVLRPFTIGLTADFKM